MAGESDLSKLLDKLNPELNEGEYVFVTVENLSSVPRDKILAEFKEKEGITLILPKNTADQAGLSYDFVAAWITLSVHSSLDAVGLTAAVSSALTRYSISCNVVAAHYHDHLFVNKKDAQAAMEVLASLAMD